MSPLLLPSNPKLSMATCWDREKKMLLGKSPPWYQIAPPFGIKQPYSFGIKQPYSFGIKQPYSFGIKQPYSFVSNSFFGIKNSHFGIKQPPFAIKQSFLLVWTPTHPSGMKQPLYLVSNTHSLGVPNKSFSHTHFGITTPSHLVAVWGVLWDGDRHLVVALLALHAAVALLVALVQLVVDAVHAGVVRLCASGGRGGGTV